MRQLFQGVEFCEDDFNRRYSPDVYMSQFAGVLTMFPVPLRLLTVDYLTREREVQARFRR